MSDKGKRINASGHHAEATVKRTKPFGRGRAVRESQRRASAYGRVRGNA